MGLYRLHEDLNLTHQRTPSPISEMENPIASVLEGMRVQRMSLVQSLRQYLFVHRGECSRHPKVRLKCLQSYHPELSKHDRR